MSQQAVVSALANSGNKLLGLLQALPAEKCRQVVQLLLVAWILYSLSQLVWLLAVDHEVAVPASADIASLPPTSAKASAVDVAAIQSWHLFGRAEKSTKPVPVAEPKALAGLEDKATDTRLKLDLLGVALAHDPVASRAMIAHQGKQAQYAIDDKLPGGTRVTLAKVLADRVILNNAGKYESLWLFDDKKANRRNSQSRTMSASQRQSLNRLASINAKKNKALSVAAGGAASESSKVVDHREDPDVKAVMADAKERLYSDPLSLSDLLQVAPAMKNGQLVGYRISPGKNPEQFNALGLKRGDIVTAINGTSLDDPQNSVKLYQQFRSLSEAQVDVLRGEEQFSIQVSTE